jgi:hypothetical protein
MSKLLTPILDELNKRNRIRHMLETLTGEARQDFLQELHDLILDFDANQETVDLYLKKRYPVKVTTPPPAAAPVKGWDPYDL